MRQRRLDIISNIDGLNTLTKGKKERIAGRVDQEVGSTQKLFIGNIISLKKVIWTKIKYEKMELEVIGNQRVIGVTELVFMDRLNRQALINEEI